MKYVMLALQYLPYVLQAVNEVEKALIGAAGQAKKAAVLAAVTAAAAVGGTVPEDHVKVISTLIDTIVGAFNASGWFTKSAPKA